MNDKVVWLGLRRMGLVYHEPSIDDGPNIGINNPPAASSYFAVFIFLSPTMSEMFVMAEVCPQSNSRVY